MLEARLRHVGNAWEVCAWYVTDTLLVCPTCDAGTSEVRVTDVSSTALDSITALGSAAEDDDGEDWSDAEGVVRGGGSSGTWILSFP